MSKPLQAVYLSSPVKRPLIFPMAGIIGTAKTLASDTVVNSYTITLSAGHGLTGGESIGAFTNSDNPYAFFAEV